MYAGKAQDWWGLMLSSRLWISFLLVWGHAISMWRKRSELELKGFGQ
jgi:hypothetical protein